MINSSVYQQDRYQQIVYQRGGVQKPLKSVCTSPTRLKNLSGDTEVEGHSGTV
jgi:hypothetical protein